MKRRKIDRRPKPRAAFTLVEAMLSLSVTAVAGTAVLLGLGSSLQNTDESMNQAVAAGLAQQLMDEIAGCHYSDPQDGNAYQLLLGPEGAEASTTSRPFDDIDDYNGLVDQPPRDRAGNLLGSDDGAGGLRHASLRLPTSYLARWRREVSVYYVSQDTLQPPSPMTFVPGTRIAVVRVVLQDATGGERVLTQLRRVFAYIPSPD